MNNTTTVVICCAGMGTRLGIGLPKTLVSINDKPLIIYLLELLDNFNDIRIVVGFQAEKIINVVNEYRKDITFVFNYDYETTGPATSLTKALIGANETIISIGGDILITKEEFEKIVRMKECIAYSDVTSSLPTFIKIQDNKVINIGNAGQFEWQGILKVDKNKLIDGKGYIYEMIQHNLPIEGIYVKSREIDSQEDYDNAVLFYNNEFNNKEEK